MKIIYNIDESVLEEKIPVMTLQPVIENSFMHGFMLKHGEYFLEIRCYYEEMYTKIYVIDNGKGLDEEEVSKINSILAENSHIAIDLVTGKIGIYNVNRRIKYCFGDEYGLKLLCNKEEGITVEIKLPRKD